jgi:hypothetical protein
MRDDGFAGFRHPATQKVVVETSDDNTATVIRVDFDELIQTVPFQLGPSFRAELFGQVAPFVVAVALAPVFPHPVVRELARGLSFKFEGEGEAAFVPPDVLLVPVEQVARRIEGELFPPERAEGFDEPSHGVVAVVALAFAAFLDSGELPAAVVVVAAFEEPGQAVGRRGGVGSRRQYLFL